MTSPLTSQQAIDLLRSQPERYATPEQLRALAAQVDADASGKVTVLYSGRVSEGVYSNDVVKGMIAAGEDVRVINNSQAAKFLESRDFNAAVSKAYGIDLADLTSGKYHGPATDWLYNAKEGPWADASGRFVDATHGEVRAIVSDAKLDRVFVAVELPRAIANPNITMIEGIPREELVARQTSQGTQAAFEIISARAYNNVGTLNVTVNYAGTPLRENGIVQVDSRTYFAGTSIQGKTPSFTAVTRPLADRMPPPNVYVQAGNPRLRLESVPLAAEATRGLHPGVSAGMGIAGVGALVGDAYTTAKQYQALSAQGNQFGADALLRRYEGRTVGGLLGGIGAGVAYGFVAGSETGPGAFITGAVGGVVGAFAGDKIATMVTEHKVNHQTGTDGVTYVYEDGRWQNTHYQLDPAVASVPNPYGAASMRAVVTPAPAAQLAQLDYQRMTAIISLALANPATQDTRHIELDGTKWHATADGWAQQVQIPGVPNTYGIPSYITVDRPANARTTEALNQLAANRRFNNEHYAEDVAKAYVMDYYGKGWSANGPLPEVVTEALGLASEEHIADPRTGKVWNADGHGHFSREETRLIGRVVIHETHGASGEERTRLGQLEQLAVHSNADYGQQLIAQKYEKWLAAQLHVRASAESYAAVGADHQTPLESSPASHDAVVTAPLAVAGVAPITPASSDHAMFDALVTAARSLDIEAMRSIGQNYLQSERGQAWLAQGQQLNQQLALQAGREAQAQQAAVMQR